MTSRERLASTCAVECELEKTKPQNMKLSSVQTLKVLGQILLSIIMKFWRLCATGVFVFLLIFWLYGGIVALSLLTMSFLGLLYNAQDKLLYFPSEPSSSRIYVPLPPAHGLPFENLTITTSDGVSLNMFLMKQHDTICHSAPTVLFLHGNAGNIGHRMNNAYMFYQLNGFNVLLVEYRGYGKSTGSPSEHGFYLDAMAAYDYLLTRRDIDHKKIIIFGRSLGGAVAIDLASRPKYKTTLALVIENTFTSIPHMALHLFSLKILEYLPYWCYKNKFLSLDKIRTVKVPTLFLSGLADNLISPKMMRDLYNACKHPKKRICCFEEGTHNETWLCAGYHEQIHSYIKDISSQTGEEEMGDLNPTDAPFDDKGLHGVLSI